MVFPEGVRGSRSNPAEITGVDFCVGTLTNKPAFHAMSPVKSSEGETVTAAGTSEGAKKGWEERKHWGHMFTADDHVMFAGTGGQGQRGATHTAYISKDAQGWGVEVTRLNTKHGGISGGRMTHESNGHATVEDAMDKAESVLPKDGWHHGDFGKDRLRSSEENFMTDKEIGHMAKEQHGHDMEVAGWAHNRVDDAAPHIPTDKTKASSATSGEQVHAHCKHTLLQDVPDATAAEIACYDKCIDEGGSHITAVTEIKSQRKPEHVTQKATLAGVYEKVLAGGTSEGAKKGWSHRGKILKQTAFDLFNKHVGSSSSDKMSDALSQVENPTDKHVHDIVSKEWGPNITSEINETFSKHFNMSGKDFSGYLNASGELTPDSIYATLEQRLEAANSVAKSKGVISVEDVYEKVTASGTSEGAKKGAETKKFGVYMRGGSIGEHRASDHPKHGKLSTVHENEEEAKEKAKRMNSYLSEGEKKYYGIKYHVKPLEEAAKASDSTSSDPIQATWSDAARQAAAASRKSSKAAGFHQKEAELLKPGGEAPFATGKLAHEASSRAFHSGDKRDHKEAMELHDKAATAARNVGNDNLADQHVEHILTHRKHADLVNKASEAEISLESIYARAGANR